MAKVCEGTGKKAMSGQNRSHSNRATKRKFGVNLQKVKIDGKTMKVSARYMKTLAKQGK